MKKMEKPRKPLIFYYAIVLVVMILLNTLLFPRLMGQEVTQVDYGTFLTMLADRKVAVAQVEQDMIYFTDTAETPGVYATSAFNDPELVNRLWESGCRFAEVKPREMRGVSKRAVKENQKGKRGQKSLDVWNDSGAFETRSGYRPVRKQLRHLEDFPAFAENTCCGVPE